MNGISETPRRGALLYLLIAFAWSWAVGAVVWRTGALSAPKPALFSALAFIYMWGPSIAALICAFAYDKGRRLAALGLRLPRPLWLVWAWVIPVVLIGGATLVDWAGPQVSPADPGAQVAAQMAAAGTDPAEAPLGPALMGWLTVAMALTLGPAINTAGTLTEELGWRGFLWDRWRRLGFWRGNIAIGAVWGVWHAPLIAMGYNYPGMPLLGPVLMTLFCIGLAPLIGLVRERGRSVWCAALFHGTVNALTGASMVLLSTGTAFPWMSLLGAGGAVTMGAGWALTWLYLRRRQPRLDVS